VTAFIVRRLLLAIPTLVGVLIVAFLLLYVAPGDPVQAMVGERADSATIAALRAELRLDDPLPVQFGHYVGGVVKGDLGRSYITNRPIIKDIIERFPKTLQLAGAAMLLATICGVTLGIFSWAALQPEEHSFSFEWLDRVLDLLARLYTANLRRTRLSPAVQAAVDRVIAEHPVNPVKLFNGLGDLFDWLRAHREEVLAIVDLVASATQEAERFAGLSGPKKQAYARELLVTFVEVEFGPRYAQALESPLARVILDTVIDGVVMVFRKRGAFRPEVPRVPPAAALGVRQDRVMREVRLRRLRQAA